MRGGDALRRSRKRRRVAESSGEGVGRLAVDRVQRRQLRPIRQRIERERQTTLGDALEFHAELSIREAPLGQVHVANADLVRAEVGGEPRPRSRPGYAWRRERRKVGHGAAVVPQVLHSAEEAAGVENHIGRTALTQVVGAKLVDVPDQLDVPVLHRLTGPHAVLPGKYPHGNADILQLVVDVVARIIDRIDDVEYAEQIRSAPHHLLAAELQEQLLLVEDLRLQIRDGNRLEFLKIRRVHVQALEVDVL